MPAFRKQGNKIRKKLIKYFLKQMPDGVYPPGIFVIQSHIYRTEVMQIGKRTARTDMCPFGRSLQPRPFVENRLFERGGFGTFCDGNSPAFSVSCVLDKGGGTA